MTPKRRFRDRVYQKKRRLRRLGDSQSHHRISEARIMLAAYVARMGGTWSLGENRMNEVLETAKPLTEWLYTEDGLRYRWIALDKNEITSLRESVRDRSENTEPSVCKSGK